MEWADWIRGRESGTQGTVDQDSKNYLSIKSGMTVNGNMRHSRGTIASSNFESGTAGYSLDAATGNIETNSDLICGNIHVKAAIDDVNISGASGNAIIGVSTSAQHLAFDANEIMSKSDATTAGVLYLQHNGGTLAVGAGAVGTFRVGSDDGTTHKSVASFSHGSHGVPSITFNSDLDTGFFREGSNTIGSTGNFTMSKDGSSATLTVSTFADAPGTESIIVLRSADNTLASPALRDSGDNLGEIHFAGHDGTDYAVGAKISVAASAATGNNDMGATIKLQTTPDDSQTPTTRLAIDHAGHVFITAASSDTTVDLDGVSGDLLVGTVDGGDQHVAISDQIIQVKTDGTTAGNLYLNNTGGEVHIGNAATEGKISILDNGIYRFGDATDTYINIKQGAAGSTGQIRWTFASDDHTAYATMGIVYDNRATDGWKLDVGYPITIDGKASTNPAIQLKSNGTLGMSIGSTGVVNIPTYLHMADGSESYPSYAFGNDSDTGMYRNGGDIVFRQNGQNALVISGTRKFAFRDDDGASTIANRLVTMRSQTTNMCPLLVWAEQDVDTGSRVASVFMVGVNGDSSNLGTNDYWALFRRGNGSNAGYLRGTGSLSISYASASDKTLKNDLGDAGDVSSIIDAIDVRKFTWKDGDDPNRVEIGLYAQDILALQNTTILPLGLASPASIIREQVNTDDEGAEPIYEEQYVPAGIDYAKFTPLLIQEVKSLRQRIAALES